MGSFEMGKNKELDIRTCPNCQTDNLAILDGERQTVLFCSNCWLFNLINRFWVSPGNRTHNYYFEGFIEEFTTLLDRQKKRFFSFKHYQHYIKLKRTTTVEQQQCCCSFSSVIELWK